MLNIMSDWKLSADELLLIWLTLYSRDEENHAEYFNKWFDDCNGKEQLKTLFESLKTKGVILKNYNPESYIPNQVEFNKHFLNNYYKQSGVLGKELFDNYEPFIRINGKMASLKNISKKFYTLEEFYFYYSSQIGHNIKKHQEIMDILEWAKSNNLVKISILEFVASHKWNEFKMMKDEGWQPDIATSYDVYQNY